MLFIIIGCSFHQDIYIDEKDVFNTVDAVASASEEIRIKEGKAYSNYTILETYHKDSYLNHYIAYGITDYTDTIIMPNFPWDNVCTLKNLIPSTSYKFVFMGNYPPQPELESHSVSGFFNTSSGKRKIE